MTKTANTHAERALITLRQRILSGNLPGETRLFEVALAEDLEVSRTPVRAALSKLAEEGLLDRAKGGGFIVRSFNLADVTDTIELRGVLEGTAARFAAERGITPEQLREAEEIIQKIDHEISQQDVDMASYSDLNAQFHDVLSRMAGSDALARQIRHVTALPFASPSAFLDDETHVEQLLRSLKSAHDQHRAIIEAIVNREGSRAEALAREHARTARRNVTFLISQETASLEGVPTLALLQS